jgi:ureidoacrylate peracid hydrolase
MEREAGMSEVRTDPAAPRPRQILRTLDERVDPRHCALVVVDVQNDFCHEQGALALGGSDMTLIQEMVPRLAGSIEAARAAGVPVLFLRIVQSDRTNSDAWESLERDGSNRLVVAGTWGAAYYGQIAPLESEVEIIKHRHSGFNFTPLDSMLRSLGIKTVVLGGVASNVCVEATARDAADYDYYVVVLSDGSAAARKELHDAALYTVDNYLGLTARCDEVGRVWSAAAGSAPPPP